MRLNVFREHQGSLTPVGVIETLPGLEEHFSYAKSYLASRQAQPLSQSLPLQEEAFSASAARPYFEGLLPEGQSRSAIARELGVKSSSYLRILAQVGLECIGDVVIASEDVDVCSLHPEYQPVTCSQLEKYTKNGARSAPELQAVTRLSLAGAQSKIGLYHENGAGLTEGWHLPRSSAPSTHILKFSSTDYPELILNEYLCLEVARACGLVVPTAQMLPTENPALCLQRYDREIIAGESRAASGLPLPTRLHQEDLAQALGVLSEKKYDEYLWNGYDGIAWFLTERAVNPGRDIAALIKMILFNYLIGNCDNHLKNYSVLYSLDWSTFSLAPSYDVVSTVCYEQLERIMAMKIGEHNHIDKVTRDDFKLLSNQLGVSASLIKSEGDRLAKQLTSTLDKSIAGLPEAQQAKAAEVAGCIAQSALPRIEILVS